MNPEYGSPLSTEAGPDAARAARLPLTVWIEQLQEVRAGRWAAPDPVRHWEDTWLSGSSRAATRREVDELRDRVAQLAQRIEALEHGSSVPARASISAA